MARKKKSAKGTTPASKYGVTCKPIEGEVLTLFGADCRSVGSGTSTRRFQALVERDGVLYRHHWNAYQSGSSPWYTGSHHDSNRECLPVDSMEEFLSIMVDAELTRWNDELPPQVAELAEVVEHTL